MATKTEILIYLVLFYAILTVFVGYIGNYFNEDVGIDSTQRGITGTNFNIITGLEAMGTTFNLVFFGSFLAILIWIFVSSTALFSGSGG